MYGTHIQSITSEKRNSEDIVIEKRCIYAHIQKYNTHEIYNGLKAYQYRTHIQSITSRKRNSEDIVIEKRRAGFTCTYTYI